MRKIMMLFCIILLLFSLVACKQGNTTNDLIRDIGRSSKFTEKEITEAIDSVIDSFSFLASTLTKVWYDEEKSNSYIISYLKDGIKSENIIVLLSNFDVDGSGDNPVLNSNSTYTDYQWILIRDNSTSDWRIDDWGY